MVFLKVMLFVFFFVIGTIFASFGNMLMYRFANDKPILKDSRSYCPKCKHQIAWYDNIPLISFLVLRGKCRHCKEKISPRYFIVELYGGVSFVIFALLYLCLYPTGKFEISTNVYDFINALTIAFSILFLLICAYVDHFKQEVPISMMVVLLVLALINFISNWIINGFSLSQVLGFAIPLVILILIYSVCIFLLKVEALGLADIIIFSILGLELGAINLLSVVLFSSLICSVIEIIRMKKTKERKTIPFVPYIYIGTLITVLFTPLIIEGINNFIGGII